MPSGTTSPGPGVSCYLNPHLGSSSVDGDHHDDESATPDPDPRRFGLWTTPRRASEICR